MTICIIAFVVLLAMSFVFDGSDGESCDPNP